MPAGRERSINVTSAGFGQIELEPTRIYDVEDTRRFLAGQCIDVDALAPVFTLGETGNDLLI